MIFLHIGMPKSGSSSLQGYLAKNTEFLEGNRVHYARSGRVFDGTKRVPLPSHNTLAKQMHSGWKGLEGTFFDQYIEELRANSENKCVISGEMFYGMRLAQLHEKIFRHVDSPVSVVIYLRRFSDFLEADYKQKAKKGRQEEPADIYARNSLHSAKEMPEFMNFSLMFKQLEEDIPNAKIIPRIFSRGCLEGGDIITDFMSLLGIDPSNVQLPEKASNRSLSRVASEALGLFAAKEMRLEKRLHRQVDVALQNHRSGEFVGKGDVFLPEEAEELDAVLGQKNQKVVEEHFPHLKALFPAVETYSSVNPRGGSDELLRFKSTVREIHRTLNRIK